ncbi:MAG: acireductone synthase [Verrucomicrobiota bacterium]
MIRFGGRLLLLDIEGTVAPLAFVHEILFPHARARVDAYLAENWPRDEVRALLDRMARDDGASGFSTWCPHPPVSDAAREWVGARVKAWMDADAKLGGLKELQGWIWEAGFVRGELRSPLFSDVPEALRTWRAAGRRLRIYSSGSAGAQRLFFRHAAAGDLSSLLEAFHDTRVGPKRSAGSYRAIVAETGLEAREILFLSDVREELDAAGEAGLATALVRRPGNPPAQAGGHAEIRSLAEVEWR